MSRDSETRSGLGSSQSIQSPDSDHVAVILFCVVVLAAIYVISLYLLTTG
jgi:hypothetical protein